MESAAKSAYIAQAYTACSNLAIPESEGCKKNATDEELKALRLACDKYESYADNGQRGKSQNAARIAIPIVTAAAGGAARGRVLRRRGL